MQPRIYVYKITFQEVPLYYFGVHKEKTFNEEYMGSPVTHKGKWQIYTPQKEILREFDYTDDGWLEALDYETTLIRPVYNIDNNCLNESCGGRISLAVCREATEKSWSNLTPKQRSERAKKGRANMTPKQRSDATKKARAAYLANTTHEQRSEVTRKGKKKQLANTTPEQRSAISRKGRANMTPKQRSDVTKKARAAYLANTTHEQRSASARKREASKTPQQRSAEARKRQTKFQCTVTGYISTAGPLAQYQRARGIDTSNRVKVIPPPILRINPNIISSL
jgi:hypothetical protein